MLHCVACDKLLRTNEGSGSGLCSTCNAEKWRTYNQIVDPLYGSFLSPENEYEVGYDKEVSAMLYGEPEEEELDDAA